MLDIYKPWVSENGVVAPYFTHNSTSTSAELPRALHIHRSHRDTGFVVSTAAFPSDETRPSFETRRGADGWKQRVVQGKVSFSLGDFAEGSSRCSDDDDDDDDDDPNKGTHTAGAPS